VETSDTFYFILYPKKLRIDKRKKTGYVYILDCIATANGEVGISGLRSSPCQMSPIIGTTRRAQRQQPVNSSIVVNNFRFNSNRHYGGVSGWWWRRHVCMFGVDALYPYMLTEPRSRDMTTYGMYIKTYEL
jgi:hypothetical protein